MKLFINRPMKKPLSLDEILDIMKYAEEYKKDISLHVTHRLAKKVMIETVLTDRIDVSLFLLDEYLKNDLKSITSEEELTAYKIIDWDKISMITDLHHDGLKRVVKALVRYQL